MNLKIIRLLFVIAFVTFFSTECLCQRPVFVCTGKGNLYSLNLNNCSLRLIGNTGQTFQDIAFTPNGNLWGISENALYQIDTTNAFIKLIGFSYPATFTSALVALNDSILLGDYNDSLYGINTKNSKGYNIGYIGYEDCGDLSWVDNVLYMNTCAQLIRINLNSNFTKIISATPINSFNSPLPQMYGLATLTINGINNLIGFTGPYTISIQDGSFQQICENLDTIAVYGAASISYPSSLPLSLLNFTYHVLGSSIVLEWQTLNEVNSSFFKVEYSVDGLNFNPIATIKAVGKSSSISSYNYTHLNPQYGQNYYRLKIVDNDGKIDYSNIIKVFLNKNDTYVFYPNPCKSYFVLEYPRLSKSVEIFIVNNMGLFVKKLSLPINSTSIKIDVRNFSNGFYRLLSTNSSISTIIIKN